MLILSKRIYPMFVGEISKQSRGSTVRNPAAADAIANLKVNRDPRVSDVVQA